MSAKLINYRSDELASEGATYLDSFWRLRLSYMRMVELEAEFERSMLAQEMNEFHRRCTDNDRPGKRHMLPFYWRRERDFNGVITETQSPIKVGSPRYELQMAEYKTRMDELKRRTPNYGR